jgi:hypothetical protein
MTLMEVTTMNDDIKNITSAMPDHVINDALDTIFNGRRKYTGFRIRMEKHEYTVEDDQQAFVQWVEQRERDLNNMED